MLLAPTQSIGGPIFDTFELRILASVALVLSLFVAYKFVRLLDEPLQERYGSNASEAVRTLILASWIMFVAWRVTIVWDIAFFLELIEEALLVDRWTAIRQVVTVAFVISAYLVIRLVNRSFDRLEAEGAITKHQNEVAYHLADATIVIGTGTVLLTLWGINLTNVILGAGVISAVFGLAAQKTVAGAITGFLLLFTRPFRVGDWIGVVTDHGDEREGIVDDVTLLHTKIRTFNDEHVLIPNDEITASSLTNYSRNDRLRIDIEIGVDYDTDLDHARELVQKTAESTEHVINAPTPKVVIKHLGDSAIVLELQFWIEKPSRRLSWRAQTEVLQAVIEVFDEHGIEIPYPQRVHDTRQEDGLRLDASKQPPEVVSNPDTEME